MELREPLPDNPTLEDIAKQMRTDHECRDQQHEETKSKISANNFRLMLATGTILLTIVGGGWKTLTLIGSSVQYFDGINSKLNMLFSQNENQDKKIDQIYSQQIVNMNNITHLQETSQSNHKLLLGANGIIKKTK